ncbi:MAG: hypothetical protein QM479_12220 [Pseudomonadota bacterium]
MVAFLESLRWQSSNTGTIHLILDGAGYHKAQILKEYIDPGSLLKLVQFNYG